MRGDALSDKSKGVSDEKLNVVSPEGCLDSTKLNKDTPVD